MFFVCLACFQVSVGCRLNEEQELQMLVLAHKANQKWKAVYAELEHADKEAVGTLADGNTEDMRPALAKRVHDVKRAIRAAASSAGVTLHEEDAKAMCAKYQYIEGRIKRIKGQGLERGYNEDMKARGHRRVTLSNRRMQLLRRQQDNPTSNNSKVSPGALYALSANGVHTLSHDETCTSEPSTRHDMGCVYAPTVVAGDLAIPGDFDDLVRPGL